eukprot:13485653-Alexandrium_andersonii.AAC.1
MPPRRRGPAKAKPERVFRSVQVGNALAVKGGMSQKWLLVPTTRVAGRDAILVNQHAYWLLTACFGTSAADRTEKQAVS